MTNGIRLLILQYVQLFMYLLLLEQRHTSIRGKAIKLVQKEPYPYPKIPKNQVEPCFCVNYSLRLPKGCS